jgi:hypothetical protein
VDRFLDLFSHNLNKHITERWRNNKLIVYLLSGEPELAKQLALTLVYWDGDAVGNSVDEKGEPINNDTQYADYADKQITLGAHHTTSDKCGPVRLNVKSVMLWLTERADFREILATDRFVKKHWHLIEELEQSNEVV